MPVHLNLAILWAISIKLPHQREMKELRGGELLAVITGMAYKPLWGLHMGKIICCNDKTGANKGTSKATPNLPSGKRKRTMWNVRKKNKKAEKNYNRIWQD